MKVADIEGVRKQVVTVGSTSRLGEVSRTMRMAASGPLSSRPEPTGSPG